MSGGMQHAYRAACKLEGAAIADVFIDTFYRRANGFRADDFAAALSFQSG